MAATTNLGSQFYQPPLGRRSAAAKSLETYLSHPKHAIRRRNSRNWTVKSSYAEQSRQISVAVDVKRLVDFLYEDLHHVFDDQGIDRTAYDERFMFMDPITKHYTIGGHLFNIALLKKLFMPEIQLHWVKQSGPYEITARWTVAMRSILLPWKPELVLTGTSLMGINPNTHKFCSHVDSWDSIRTNEYFSIEGLLDVINQLLTSKIPDLELPKYHVLKRTASYEIRKYAPSIAVETNGNKPSGTTGLPDHNHDAIRTMKVEGGIAAVSKFTGEATEDISREKEKALRSSLTRDGLKPETGCLLARYNDSGLTWTFTMRNEVLIWLEEFKLD